MTAAILLCLAAYVAGSIPFGVLVARAKGVDLRTGRQRQHRRHQRRPRAGQGLGDRRPGWPTPPRGSSRSGWGAAWDFRAGPIAAAGLAAIVGHMFTVFLRGRGGKGVATSLGVALALSPVAALIGFGVYIVVFAATRLSSLGSLLGVWTFSVSFVVRQRPPWPLWVLALGGAALVTLRHRQNIGRLLRGEEKRA